jgi:hypothetical protein
VSQTTSNRLNVHAGDTELALIAVEELDLAEAAARVSISVTKCERRTIAARKEPGQISPDDRMKSSALDLVNALFWLEQIQAADELFIQHFLYRPKVHLAQDFIIMLGQPSLVIMVVPAAES